MNLNFSFVFVLGTVSELIGGRSNWQCDSDNLKWYRYVCIVASTPYGKGAP